MGWHIGSPEVVDREAVARKNAVRRDDVCQSVFARRKRRNSATGKPPKPKLSISTSSMITKVESNAEQQLARALDERGLLLGGDRVHAPSDQR
jgi:hypothetical protein